MAPESSPACAVAGAPSCTAARIYAVVAEQIEEAEPRWRRTRPDEAGHDSSGQASRSRHWGSRPAPLLSQRVDGRRRSATPSLPNRRHPQRPFPNLSSTGASDHRAESHGGGRWSCYGEWKCGGGAAAAVLEGSRPAIGMRRKETTVASSMLRLPSPSASSLAQFL
ncbi:unnamed protein product [Urochloa humidicola]